MKKTLLILGAGTGGTIIANKMAHRLDPHDWQIILVDRDQTHYYQPGFLFIPFGIYQPEEVMKPKQAFLPAIAELVFSEIERIEPDASRVILAKDKRVITYDQLIIATGASIHPEETPGLEDGWREDIFDFYTFDGSVALAKRLANFDGGRLVINVTEMPIKCPVAPLEFAFLADTYFRKRGIRDKVDLIYATPLSGAFTKPRASNILSSLLDKKGIHIEPDFAIGEVDPVKQVIRSFDDREIGFDLLVSVPTNMGAEVIGNSGMGNELNYLPINKNTLQSKKWPNVWAIGDATDAPTSKAGAVAHFEADILTENLTRATKGLEPTAFFDGHANCFIESGAGKGFLIDFNYEVEPLPGKFPIPGVGPFSLLGESAINHMGKLSFRWIYWNFLLKGYPIPVIGSHMSMAGKQMHSPIMGNLNRN